jgi:hypothetical protein
MCRYKESVGFGLQNGFEQITGIQSQNRPPIGTDVSDTVQGAIESPDRFDAGHEDQVVVFTGFSLLFIVLKRTCQKPIKTLYIFIF